MTNVRPSSTFLSVPRYTSSYIKREKCDFEIQHQVPDSDPDPFESEMNHFKAEMTTNREKLLNEKKQVVREFRHMYNSTIPAQLGQSDSKTLLVSPKFRRDEVQQLKQSISKYKNLKEQAMFVNKRNRQLKFGYRDKVRDVIIRPKTSSNFFSSRIKEAKEEHKPSRNSQYRMKVLRENTGKNSQIEFFNDNKNSTAKYRKDPSVDIAIGWNRKKEPAVKFNGNTFNNLFGC